MSEEKIQNTEEKNCCKNLTVLVIVTLMFSVATFALTLLNTLLQAVKAPAHVGAAPTAAAPSAPAVQENKDVIVISKQFDKGQSLDKALATKKPMVVFFYTDWCGYCQRFAPTFHKVVTSKAIKNNFAIAYVNCDSPENQKHMEKYKVNAFPTVFVVDTKGNSKQLENGTFFTDDAAKNLPVDMLKVIGK